MSAARDTGFSAGLPTGAGALWDRALGHRMFREVAADTVRDADFGRYLRIEFGFVDTAAAVLGQAVAKAPSFAARRRLAAALGGLTRDQHDFFVEAFRRLGIGGRVLRPRAARGLSAHFRRVARDGGYAEILAAMLGAEWLYLTWCRRAHATPSARPVVADWVALHVGADFAGQVAWMRGELDRIAPALSGQRRAGLRRVFTRTLEHEIDFHDVVYGRSARGHGFGAGEGEGEGEGE